MFKIKSGYLLATYIVAALLFFALFGSAFIKHFTAPTYFIAPIMAVGSFIAGSTFLGGGAVAFPALTKFMHITPIDAKTFSLAIQSVGMSAASIYIITRVALPWGFISLYLSSAAAGIYFSLAELEHLIASVDLRIGFSLFLLCFLALYLCTRHSHNVSTETHLEKKWPDLLFTLGAGLLGGLISGLLGSGADLIGFSLLALYFRIEIKRATQISVVLMAATALMGLFVQGIVFQRVSEQVWSLWYIAAPVVLFGAPLGAVFCRRMTPLFLLVMVCLIVSSELISTLLLVQIEQDRIMYYGAALIISILLMLLLLHKARHKHR